MDILYETGRASSAEMQRKLQLGYDDVQEIKKGFSQAGLIDEKGFYIDPKNRPQSKAVIIGRWIGVIPVAIASLLTATFVANMLFSFQQAYVGATPDSLMSSINKFILGPAIAAMACVYYGSKTAPKYRKVVSMTLAALMTIVATVGVISSIAVDGEVVGQIIAAIASIVASGYIVYLFFEEGDNFEAFK